MAMRGNPGSRHVHLYHTGRSSGYGRIPDTNRAEIRCGDGTGEKGYATKTGPGAKYKEGKGDRNPRGELRGNLL